LNCKYLHIPQVKINSTGVFGRGICALERLISWTVPAASFFAVSRSVLNRCSEYRPGYAKQGQLMYVNMYVFLKGHGTRNVSENLGCQFEVIQ
jgi:hypothetical protein